MTSRYLERILNARVYDVARQTPLQRADLLSRRLGAEVYLKREDLQPVFSFKLRGAYNKLYQLSQSTELEHVIAVSAGNHAQGVALAARTFGIKATIVMPETTPPIKISAVRSLGARIDLHGDGVDEAYAHAVTLAKRDDAPLIHPYDDPDIIAGQGTVAAELLRQHENALHAVFVPVGGGGLIAGMAVYIKALRPDIRVIGVEPNDAAGMQAALRAGRRVKLPAVGLFVDGVAVRQVGREPFRLARRFVDEVITVDTDEVCAAIRDVFEDTRSIAEPAGALAVAGMKRYAAGYDVDGRALAAVVSGANMNFDRLRHVSERAGLGEQREMLMAVEIPEKPGSFRSFCRALGKRGITEFNYRYADSKRAYIFVGVELNRTGEERETILGKLRGKGYTVTDMSDNEMAKLHVRYMVGGHSPALPDERLLRLEFPERPGALLNFLEHMQPQWNISLFHYRNHGAAYGRVLVGLQIPGERMRDLQASLREVGYTYWDETDNPAYGLFLK